MTSKNLRCSLLVVALLGMAIDVAQADVPQTVPVGNSGNKADTTGFGAVDYPYKIGKYEVTNARYCEFLEAAAKKDPHSLYDSRMAGEYGGIARNGPWGSYSYSLKDGMGKKPVNYVTFESCTRFCNWLTNGCGAGDTETGSYTFKQGKVQVPNHAALAAGKTTKWVVAGENEWYKAAYYDPNKLGGAGYWQYATKSNETPTCNINTNAPSDVGGYAPSPYGTYDQNGNMWEYSDTRNGDKVGLRGGSFYLNDNATYLRSTTRYDVLSAKWPNYGFRVVALGAAAGRTAASGQAVKAADTVPGTTAPKRTKPATFYVSQSTGNDSWSGQTVGSKRVPGPWKTLARASSIEYIPGDRILLKCGDTWNEELHPQGNGTPERPIIIGSYGRDKKPVIDREDYKKDRFGIHLIDQGGFKIVGIEFNRCMTGIYGEYSDGCPIRRSIWIENCYFHDSLLYQHYEDYPKRKIGLGVCFFSHERDNRIVLADVTVKNCVFRRLASGFWTNSPDNFNKYAGRHYNFANFTFDGCLFEEGYQWQLGIRGVDGGAVRNCITHDIGRGFRSFSGVAGAMFFRAKDWVFEDSEWGFIDIGLGSGDGEAFDFEGTCDNMTMRNCLFHDTDGPGFLLCCYASSPEPNLGVVMENCVLNGKSKRPIGLPRCEIVNTTDWNEAAWKNCRFYLAKGEVLMRVMDPEKDKRSSFVNCVLKDLSKTCSTPKLDAKATASSEAAGHEAAKAADDNPATAWKAAASENEWIQLDFGKAVTVNEFKIKEEPSSSVLRYCIECWDDKDSKWMSCFNGRHIGREFVAPIVGRTTQKTRLLVIRTTNGNLGIAEFAAYHDTSGEIINVPRGSMPPGRAGE